MTVTSRRLGLIVAIAAFAPSAFAQTLPWPTDPPAGRPGGASAPIAAPAPMVPQQSMAPTAPMGQPMGAPSPAMQECAKQFTSLRTNAEKLRDVLEKVAASARSKSDNRASREDLCKAIGSYASAEGKWGKFATDNSTKCGIPPDIGKQITAANAKTLAARKNICSAGPSGGGAPPAPSLSDALGTSRQSLPDSSQSRRGTFDTLTGSAIAR